jgi:hypothetical protein
MLDATARNKKILSYTRPKMLLLSQAVLDSEQKDDARPKLRGCATFTQKDSSNLERRLHFREDGDDVQGN